MIPEPIEPKTLDAQTTAAKLESPLEATASAALAELLISGEVPIECMDEVSACLEHESPHVRILTVELLTRQGGAAVSALMRGLEETQLMPVRIAAASGLGRIGPDAAPATDRLCECLAADDPQLRRHAGFALGKIGAATVPSLRGLFESTDPLVVSAAVDALEWIGRDAVDAVEDLRQLATSTSLPLLRLACNSALVKISGNVSETNELIRNMLQHEDKDIRKACLERVGMLGNSGGEYVPMILVVLEDPDAEVRAAAALALARIEEEPSRVLGPLTDRLSDPDEAVRANAAMGLARYGPAAYPALPALIAMRQDALGSNSAAIAQGAIEKIEAES
ncbi:MAG: HEAT repeat domain-containing protein [Syntrophobacteraceae bacterium]